MIKLPKFKKGTIYLIEFWDHSATGENVAYSDVIGWFHNEDKLHVCLLYWRTYHDGPGSHLDYDDIERSNILKTCITKVRKIL